MHAVVSGRNLSPDAIVVGGGLVGLTSSVALAERGLSVLLLAESRIGEASPAAAGMLAPSVERATGPAHAFAMASRDRYPSYIEFLADRTGVSVPLNRLGILQVALSEKGVKGLRKSQFPLSRWLDVHELRDLEPALTHALGAVLNPDDGAVDNATLLTALEKYIETSSRVKRIRASVTGIRATPSACVVTTEAGAAFSAGHAVIAAGAWSGRIPGAPFARPVQPARGQLVSYSRRPLRHVAYGPRGYVVPRGDATIGGSTMENTGFDASVTVKGIAKVRQAAEEICPDLRLADPPRAWAGLRPVTPDLLPIIGCDPEHEAIIYACGHSRNGVLMAPLTGDIIADLVTATPLSHDLSQFRPGRF